jgi:CelD/BcsL family acetyltransferase involved in cellulose biosynthesis
MAAVRGDVRVVVRSEAGAAVGFLPLQLGLLGHARPLGGPLSDHHGVIGDMGDAEALAAALRKVGVAVFDFHSALAVQAPFAARGGARDGSWVIDLSSGFEAWRSRRKKPGGNTLRTILVSERKMAERHGAVEFCFDDGSEEALQAMFDWKSDQYRRTGHFDVFSVDWTRKLVSRLLRSDLSSGARGVVSSLRVDGQLAAVHFGMMGGGVMHYWFPAYDPAYQKEGGGNALLVRLLQEAGAQGVREIHLGGGDYRYKAALADWQFPIVSGFVGAGAGAAVRALADRAEVLGAGLKLGPLRDLPGRAFRRIDRIAGFRPA